MTVSEVVKREGRKGEIQEGKPGGRQTVKGTGKKTERRQASRNEGRQAGTQAGRQAVKEESCSMEGKKETQPFKQARRKAGSRDERQHVRRQEV